MGRSFYRAVPANMVEDFRERNTFYHPASDRHYEMLRRGDAYYQRRYQVAPDSSRVHVIEKRIDFVLGSGNHARTYLSRTADGRLLDLPVAWYPGRGGYWEMAPGYDRPDHVDFRREITAECIFCHNAYGDAVFLPGDETPRFRDPLPEGIGCQRCHGPGRAHSEAAARSASAPVLRAAIVNPARLSPERAREVCLQCHLESTSRRLPYAIRRYGREPFSYRPGEPLADFILHWDLAPPPGTEYFEVNHAAYRLFQSACFRKSNGALSCTTCHNPHEVSAADRACRTCHATVHNTTVQRCAGCHLPKRQTQDASHVSMADHRIPIRYAEIQAPPENSSGPARPLYPPGPADALYLAVAQVKESVNLQGGIPMLEAAIRKFAPRRAEFYYDLADAYRSAGRLADALTVYEEARRKGPEYIPGLRNFAGALADAGKPDQAIQLLEATRRIAPDDARILNMLGSFYVRRERPADAERVLRRAADLNPDLPEIYVNLGVALSSRGDASGAETALRQAVTLAPDFATAHLNLAAALAAQGRYPEARFEAGVATRSPEPAARRAAQRLLDALPRP